MALSFKILEKNGVQINLEAMDAALPRHISAIADMICDQSDTIYTQFGLTPDAEREAYKYTPKWRGRLEDDEKLKIEKRAASARRTADHAEKYATMLENEAEWSDLYRERFFQPLYDSCKGQQRTESRRDYRRKLCSEFFELKAEGNWYLFEKNLGFRHKDRVGLSHPRPDYTFYFPIHNFPMRNTTGVGGSDRMHLRADREPLAAFGPMVEHFSHSVLQRLGSQGLFSNPTHKLSPTRSAGGNSYRALDMVCYPWLVVELKKKSRSCDQQKAARNCYCQAANASSAAVMMLQRAAKFARSRPAYAHVPPVIVVTGVGPVVKVFITYVASAHQRYDELDDSLSDEGGTLVTTGFMPPAAGDGPEPYFYEMANIWTGDMTNVWDVLRFEAILENAHLWATQILKPQISGFIGEWLDSVPPTPATSEASSEKQSW
ncbi:hypothetical protein Micbo1qcDRAFT_18913 [Microdochium bolleyi]|uniref:Uncharacterized protein n=1 Tax=Microdochium bolleyi TaxID=196109 RepID=A0A136ITE9_9PEZI|nr:hypothetical protein Micbo1qcDRAFT_18913 [Microdochium bolleyi]